MVNVGGKEVLWINGCWRGVEFCDCEAKNNITMVFGITFMVYTFFLLDFLCTKNFTFTYFD